jgi:hypothetical protein
MKELFDLIWNMDLKTLFEYVGIVFAVCLLIFDSVFTWLLRVHNK